MVVGRWQLVGGMWPNCLGAINVKVKVKVFLLDLMASVLALGKTSF